MENQKNILDHIKPKEFQTPDASYFRKLSEKVIQSEQPKTIPFYKKSYVWIAAAACIAFVIILQFPGSEEKSDNLIAMDTFSSADIESYIEANIEEFETDLICEYIPEDNIIPFEYTIPIELNETSVISALPLKDISTEAILEYFEEEEFDIEDVEELII